MARRKSSRFAMAALGTIGVGAVLAWTIRGDGERTIDPSVVLPDQAGPDVKHVDPVDTSSAQLEQSKPEAVITRIGSGAPTHVSSNEAIPAPAATGDSRSS